MVRCSGLPLPIEEGKHSLSHKLVFIYSIPIQLVTENEKKFLLNEGWNRKCLTARSSQTDMHLVYKITLCLGRQLSAGQTYPCLCPAITSRKQDSGGCICIRPVVLVPGERLRSRSRGSVPVAACF